MTANFLSRLIKFLHLAGFEDKKQVARPVNAGPDYVCVRFKSNSLLLSIKESEA